jgi:hypothetical protein
MASEHRVCIFPHAGTTKVWPPYLVVKAGDSVIFTAIGTSATVVFPHAAAFKPGQDKVEETKSGSETLIRVDMGTSVRLVTQDNLEDMDLVGLRTRSGGSAVTDANDQIYAYSVYCGQVNDLAQGQSSPVMLIEPPGRGDPPP